MMFFGAKEEHGHTFQVFLKAEEYFDSLYCSNCGRTPMRWMQVGKLLQSRMSTSRSLTTQVDLTGFVNCGEDSAEIMLGRAFVGMLEQREWAATKIMGRSCLVPKKSEQLECVCVLCQPLLNARWLVFFIKVLKSHSSSSGLKIPKTIKDWSSFGSKSQRDPSGIPCSNICFVAFWKSSDLQSLLWRSIWLYAFWYVCLCPRRNWN